MPSFKFADLHRLFPAHNLCQCGHQRLWHREMPTWYGAPHTKTQCQGKCPCKTFEALPEQPDANFWKQEQEGKLHSH